MNLIPTKQRTLSIINGINNFLLYQDGVFATAYCQNLFDHLQSGRFDFKRSLSRFVVGYISNGTLEF